MVADIWVAVTALIPRMCIFTLLGHLTSHVAKGLPEHYSVQGNNIKPLEDNMDFTLQDILRPYLKSHYDPKRTHRYVRDCQPIIHGNTTFEIHKSSINNSALTVLPLKYLTRSIPPAGKIKHERFANGHIATINNPIKTFSVYEPLTDGSCTNVKDIRATVAESSKAKHRKCLVSTNAGFFDTKNGRCLGNVVSNGKFVQSSNGVQNANFGIKRDGSIVVGYLPDDIVWSKNNKSSDFLQLVSGVGWLLRDGELYLDQSKKAECADTQETGTIERFFTVVSGRTAIGHDNQGRVVIAHIDGKTDKRG